MNFRLNVFPAVVKNNLDPLQEDRVQIKIAHLHSDVPNTLLPWAIPWDSSLTGGSPTSGSSKVPAVDTTIWVAIENLELLEPIYYLANFRFKANAQSGKTFYSTVKPQLLGSTVTYPDMHFTRMSNGITYGVSNGLTKEVFLYHSSGTQIFINNAGKIRVKAGNLSLATVLDTLLSQIQAITHISPVGPTGVPVNAVQFAAIQTQLATMLLV